MPKITLSHLQGGSKISKKTLNDPAKDYSHITIGWKEGSERSLKAHAPFWIRHWFNVLKVQYI